MPFGRRILSATLILATSVPCFALAHSRRGAGSSRLLHKRAKKVSLRPKGQRAIDDVRAVQIQQSLIQSGYLSATASGHWDSETEAAMRRYQGDNGWQTKLIPDSRAIIKLGLGPSQDSGSAAESMSGTNVPKLSTSAALLQK